jgi:hypothetical protein
MPERLDHDEAMELAVRLTCSYLGSSHSSSINAEELILDYYRQLRNVETRLRKDYHPSIPTEELESEEVVAQAA